ncbi:AMP-binding protein [Actinomadura graeca]|uniref:AMP-binding protein n=1 Tax=Actinomadura graeca TaxID=2750812 RepID=A0ABX8QYH6_9ACTN|nr:AMP-binding protein [Actinomadura graeca]QXJ23792.1 AMP-binding protein [Actinomadura graeca]
MTGHPRPEDMFGAATVPEVLELAARGPRGITFIDGNLRETPLPYRLLAAAARRAATALAGLGVRRGDRVAMLSSTSPRLLICLFGAWRAGAVPVVLAPPHRLSEVAVIMADIRGRLDHVGARCLVVADVFGGFVAGRIGAGRPVVTCGDLVAGRADDPPPIETCPNELAFLQYTSGTTGPAKAVALTHRQLLTNVAVCCDRLLLDGEHSVHASWAPLYHDLGLVAVLSCVASGIRMVLQPPEAFLSAPDSWLDALSRFRATSTVTPNFAYGLAARSMRLRPRGLDLSALRVCGDGSEPTRKDAADEFTARGARYGLRPEALTPMYGLAEATLSVSMGSLTEPMRWDHVRRDGLRPGGAATPAPEAGPGTRTLAVCGTAVPGVDLSIRAEDGTPLTDRVVGEICVRGPSVMRGYWRDREATAAVMRDGWLRTGDLGYRTPAGLVLSGRLKDMIIIGGANLYPEDYEHVAAQVDGVGAACAAFALPETERMVVAVEAHGGADPGDLAERVMARLRTEVGHAPDQVVVVRGQTIPLTSSGKVQRGRCRDGYFHGRLPILARRAR